MKHIYTNNINESQIDFVIAQRNNYPSVDEFYASAIRLLFDGWESHEATEVYIAQRNKFERTIDELREETKQCLKKRSQLLVVFGHCHWSEPFHPEGRNLFCNVDARVLAFMPAEKDT